jgi:hypothetical protein
MNGTVSGEAPLIFMHIPKCGGMSLYSALAEELGVNYVADLYDVSRHQMKNTAQLAHDKSMKAYCGHFSFGLHNWINRPSYYFSMVRRPEKRLESLYFFLAGMWPPLHKGIVSSGFSFFRHRMPEFHWDYFDYFFAKKPDPEIFFSASSLELDNGIVRRFSGYGLNPSPCPPEALQKAKENAAKHFSFIGVTEHYEESLVRMSKIFGFQKFREKKANVNKLKLIKKQELPTSIIKKIAKMNPYDIDFYDWVLQRFEDKSIETRATGLFSMGRRDFTEIPFWKAVGGGREKAIKSG